ncbi:SCO2322 family protein [Kitasatospora mediocidica]|uniref:SCO2322 family protein n=1 Tax=Kitasatospora mediocidica TaxID=58352 RepID=UPI00055C4FB4|nr:SCO2322 family protein [Kitasatospora mediocidica]
MTTALRRTAAGLLAAVLLGLVALLAAAPASATSYRYWSFWRWGGDSWTYQQQGATGYVPADGSVDGWRFTLSPDGAADTERPGAGGDFATICAKTPPQPGKKRVALVLDYGTPADGVAEAVPASAPRTGCAALAPGASSADALAAVAPPLRYSSAGLICAIAGYPTSGCGEAASVAAPAGAAKSAGPNLGLIAGGALVVLLGAGAWWQAGRRRSQG